jgi:hypothetical protein
MAGPETAVVKLLLQQCLWAVYAKCNLFVAGLGYLKGRVCMQGVALTTLACGPGR